MSDLPVNQQGSDDTVRGTGQMFEVELTVSITGTVRIQADDIGEARKIAERIEISGVEIDFMNPWVDAEGFDELSMVDVEVDGIFEAEDASEDCAPVTPAPDGANEKERG